MHDLDTYLPEILLADMHAFGQWMAGAEPSVRRSLAGFAASVDTESVVQETFLRVWQVAPRFQPDGKPNGLLRLAMRIARNLAISETRRLRTRQTQMTADGDIDSLAEGSQPRPSDPLLRRVIEACRQRLPDKPGKALAERLMSAGREHDSLLAARIGMTKNTFLQNITRARQFLAECLAEHGIDIAKEMP